MTIDPLALMVDVDHASGRVLATAERLTEDEIAVPSLLLGWTRGHVLSHLARNADAIGNLLTWARTGVVTPAYPSVARREADIEAGAGRSGAEPSPTCAPRSSGSPTPPVRCRPRRGRSSVAAFAARDGAPSLVVHATDIGHDLTIGSGAAAGPVVSGPAHALAGWLTGRTPGDTLTVSPSGPLPPPPDWM